MPNIKYVGGQPFHRKQDLAVADHELPGYVVKWGTYRFTFFTERAGMVDWFKRVRQYCHTSTPRKPFMPLEVVYEGQRCGFYADIECYIPREMTVGDVDTLKGEIMRYVKDAYFSRGLDSSALVWSENHRGDKVSFHVVGRDVDFEGTHADSDMARVTKKMNWDCLQLTNEYPLVGFSECGRAGKKVNLFDLAVYSRNRAMRCIYSSKEGSVDSWFTPCAGFEGRGLGEWWIVRDKGSTMRVHTEPWDTKDEEKLLNVLPEKMTAKSYNAKAFKRRMQSPTVCTRATDAQERVAHRLQGYFQDEQEDGTITVRFYGEYHRDGLQPADSYRLDGTNRRCDACSGTHTSNGAGVPK